MADSIAKRLKAARTRSFNVDIATEFGVNAAIFLGQLDYWLQHMGKEIDGEVWIYSTFENWTSPANFPFWSEKTVKRIVSDLRSQGIIVTTDEHNKMPMDKTLWYSIPGWTEQRDNVSRPSGQVVPPTSGQVVPPTSGQVVPSNNHKNTHEEIPKRPTTPADVAAAVLAELFANPVPDYVYNTSRDVRVALDKYYDGHAALVERYGVEKYRVGIAACDDGYHDGRKPDHVEKKIKALVNPQPQRGPIDNRAVQTLKFAN